MIDKIEIDDKANELGIQVANVQRDYVFGWILAGLFHAKNPLANSLILKGGNCFRKAYFEHARFSNDLDFSIQNELGEDSLRASIEYASKYAMENSGVEFLINQNKIATRNLVQEDIICYDARIYFKSFYGEENVTIKIELDISEYDKIILPIQPRKLIHSYSDSEKCTGLLHCWKLEELLAAKLMALLQRQHSPDLYDFVYAIFFQKILNISRLEVIKTFLKKTIYENSPHIARGLLLDLPFQVIRGLWKEFLVCPKSSIIAFEDAQNWFQSTIAELFGLLPSIPAFATTGGGFAPSYFKSGTRNVIFEAGNRQKTLRMVYDGLTRIVEPYSLVFKRKKDGVGKEYFYAWDRSGGHSGHIGIKSFISDKIQSIQITEEPFTPKYPIELVKGPGYFSKPFSSATYVSQPLNIVKKKFFASGNSITIKCPICGKRFKRNSYDVRLNEHKDKYGNKCFGRIGIIV